MKRVHLLLITIIFVCIAGRVAITPTEMSHPVVSSDVRDENINRFFEYKVQPVQSNPEIKSIKCPVRISRCCQV